MGYDVDVAMNGLIAGCYVVSSEMCFFGRLITYSVDKHVGT